MTTERTLTDAAAPVTTPKKRFEITRDQLGHSDHRRGCGGWPLAMRHIENEIAVVVVTDQGRVCAGIVGDSGQAGKDAIALSNSVGTLRNAAIVGGREVQITRYRQVVARIIPPERIPEYLAGRALPAPKVAAPSVAAPKATTPKVAARTATATPVPDARHAGRRNLIREAVERRLAGSAGEKAGGAAAPTAKKRGRPSGETAFAKTDEALFGGKDEVTKENLAVLDELLKG